MENKINVGLTCPSCGEAHEVEVSLVGYVIWKGGELIQNAMPDLSPDKQKRLTSGLCPKCLSEKFGD